MKSAGNSNCPFLEFLSKFFLTNSTLVAEKSSPQKYTIKDKSENRSEMSPCNCPCSFDPAWYYILHTHTRLTNCIRVGFSFISFQFLTLKEVGLKAELKDLLTEHHLACISAKVRSKLMKTHTKVQWTRGI